MDMMVSKRPRLYVSLKWCALGMISSFSASMLSFTTADFSKLDFLIGKWRMIKESSEIFEVWEKRNPSLLYGTSFKVTGRDTVFLENVRLFENDGHIIYAASAYGQNQNEEVDFELKSMQNSRFVFENLKHDYPQRVTYQKVGADSIHANIEGTVNGRSRRSDFYYSRIQ